MKTRIKVLIVSLIVIALIGTISENQKVITPSRTALPAGFAPGSGWICPDGHTATDKEVQSYSTTYASFDLEPSEQWRYDNCPQLISASQASRTRNVPFFFAPLTIVLIILIVVVFLGILGQIIWGVVKRW